MAEAYGKLTGGPVSPWSRAAPAPPTPLTACTSRARTSTPMILLIGQVARGMRGREAFQEIDYRAMFGSLAKWVCEIDDPARIPEVISRAFHTAVPGRPGPVVIALPEDLLIEPADCADAARYRSPSRSRRRRHGPPARPAGRGKAPVRGAWWRRLDRGRPRRHPGLCREVRAARRRVVPPPGLLRQYSSQLRRPRRDLGSAAAQRARQGRGPPAADRDAARRGVEPKLHADRHSRAAADPGARPPRRGGAGPGLCA